MKKMRRICLLLLTMVMLLSMVVPALGADVSTQSASGSVGLDAQKPLGGSEKLLDTAKATVLYELTSDTLVYAWNPDEQIDPSGMNKILTAMLALELGNPEDVVTVSRTVVQSAALIGSVSANLKYGEEITLKDLLFCMMVGSANDAAVVIAEHISGSEEQFVELMNRRVRDLGCENTLFVNASGLPQKGQYTTARDLAKITVAALENQLFTEMFNAISYTVPATNKAKERTVKTTNYLTSKETVKTQYDSRVTGGKTGALSTTDRSLICTAEHSGKRYLVVLMSAKGTVTEDGLSVKTFGSFEETRLLLDFGFKEFSFRQVLQSGQVLQEYSVSGGENKVFAGSSVDLYSTLPVNVQPEDVTIRCVLKEELSAPLAQGQIIGAVEIWYKEICVGTTELVAMHPVRQSGGHIEVLIPNAVASTEQAMSNWLLIGILVLVGLVLVAGIAMALIVVLRKRQLVRRHRLINGGKER